MPELVQGVRLEIECDYHSQVRVLVPRNLFVFVFGFVFGFVFAIPHHQPWLRVVVPTGTGTCFFFKQKTYIHAIPHHQPWLHGAYLQSFDTTTTLMELFLLAYRLQVMTELYSYQYFLILITITTTSALQPNPSHPHPIGPHGGEALTVASSCSLSASIWDFSESLSHHNVLSTRSTARHGMLLVTEGYFVCLLLVRHEEHMKNKFQHRVRLAGGVPITYDFKFSHPL